METTDLKIKAFVMQPCTYEHLRKSKAYILRAKIDAGERLTPQEKMWITEQVNSNSYFRDAIPTGGWMIPFGDVLTSYLVNHDGYNWHEYKAVNKTSLRRYLCVSDHTRLLEIED